MIGEREVVVVGAGLVGTAAALFLARRGYRVEVWERHSDLRTRPDAVGRSINLTLCHRGLAPLDRVGASEAIRPLRVALTGRRIHDASGAVADQPYGNRGEAIPSVSRNGLNRRLLDLAEERGVRFAFGRECVDLDPERGTAELLDRAAGAVETRRFTRLIAADGAFSAVRRRLVERGLAAHTEVFLDQGYKELRVPPAPGGGWAMPEHSLHVWPRGHYMLIAFANPDGSFTCALHLPYEGEPSLASMGDAAALAELFARSFPDALPLLPSLTEEYFGARPSAMVTVRCAPWSFAGRVLLLGDAAHAIYPSYGQGANCGFEDCQVLDECLERLDDDWTAALSEFERLRKPEAEAIADLSESHFHELREHLGDPRFLLRKRLERWLSERLGDAFLPLYSMVSFTAMPYTEAIRRESEQRPLVDRLLAVDDIEARLEAGLLDDLLTSSGLRPPAVRKEA